MVVLSAWDAGGATHRFSASDVRAAKAASLMAGEITFQRLMPLAKQTTISCSVCIRFSAMAAATNTAIGRIRLTSSGSASMVTLKKMMMLCRSSTIRLSADRLWLRKATTVRAASASSVGIRSCRSR